MTSETALCTLRTILDCPIQTFYGPAIAFVALAACAFWAYAIHRMMQ